MILFLLNDFKNDIKINKDEPRKCEGHCEFRPCSNVGVKEVEVRKCLCRKSNAVKWLCEDCIKNRMT